MDKEGETVNDPYSMAEVLRQQYESTFSKPDTDFNLENMGDFFREEEARDDDEDEDINEDEDRDAEEEGTTDHSETAEKSSPQVPQLTDVHFNFMDIADAIDQLDQSSGPGPDGLSAILLKKSKISVALMLNNIFRKSIDSSEIPDILKLGFICPILKPDSIRTKAASWRPVSLTSHVMKTWERVIRSQIVGHLECNGLMDPDQHGSRKSRSCLSQLLEHHEEILKMMEEGNNVDVIYTDFAKAYEKISHAKLLEKMKTQFGISGRLGKWVKEFLQNRMQQVLVNETPSEKSEVISGSVQGSVLGPVLFLMYIKDLSKGVTANVKIFVDDTKIKDEIQEEKDVEKLQTELDKLFEWQEANQMLFNGSKFQLLRYGPDEDLKNNTLYFTDNTEHIIERCSSLRDLGMILSDDGKFQDHIEKVCKKVRQKVGWICRSFYTRRVTVMKHLWKTLVQCHIDYCSQLYFPAGQAQGLQAIEKLFYNFTQKIPDIREEDYWSRLRSLQMYSQERRMERYRAIYMWKILEGYVPNCGVDLATQNERLGRKIKIPSLKKNGRHAVQTLREQSFQINGARLFNSLPKKIRNITKDQELFKASLDEYLSSVPDQPRIGSLVPTATTPQ